jgi:hypothetical protein
MLSGFVFCDFDNQNVLSYTGDKTSVELIPTDSTANLNRAICLGDLTEMKNIQERLKAAGFIDDVYIVNIATLYKRFF